MDEHTRQQLIKRARPTGAKARFDDGEGGIVEVIEYRRLGYTMPIQFHYNCPLFDNFSNSCTKPGAFIQGIGCWGSKCKIRGDGVNKDGEGQAESSVH